MLEGINVVFEFDVSNGRVDFCRTNDHPVVPADETFLLVHPN